MEEIIKKVQTRTIILAGSKVKIQSAMKDMKDAIMVALDALEETGLTTDEAKGMLLNEVVMKLVDEELKNSGLV